MKTKTDRCNGCGRVEPMGCHYPDCKFLDPDDLVVDRDKDDGTDDNFREPTPVELEAARRARGEL